MDDLWSESETETNFLQNPDDDLPSIAGEAVHKQSTPTRPKNKRASARRKVGVKRKSLLKKDQKSLIIDLLNGLSLDMIAQCVEVRLREQLKSSEEMLKEILDGMVRYNDKQLFMSLVKHHHMTFVHLYRQCSTGKEKFMRFQLEWHKHCSVFLLPRELNADCIFPSSECTKEIVEMRC